MHRHAKGLSTIESLVYSQGSTSVKSVRLSITVERLYFAATQWAEQRLMIKSKSLRLSFSSSVTLSKSMTIGQANTVTLVYQGVGGGAGTAGLFWVHVVGKELKDYFQYISQIQMEKCNLYVLFHIYVL